MDRGAWWVTVQGVAMSQTQLKRLSMHALACAEFSARYVHCEYFLPVCAQCILISRCAKTKECSQYLLRGMIVLTQGSAAHQLPPPQQASERG